MTNIVLTRTHDLILRVIQKFIPMSQPTDNTRNHEKDREHVSREAHCLVNNSTVKVHVRIELSLNEVRVR